jgi:hypothetical protein
MIPIAYRFHEIQKRIHDEEKNLGNSGLEVSNICFGGNVFGWTVDEGTGH